MKRRRNRKSSEKIGKVVNNLREEKTNNETYEQSICINEEKRQRE